MGGIISKTTSNKDLVSNDNIEIDFNETNNVRKILLVDDAPSQLKMMAKNVESFIGINSSLFSDNEIKIFQATNGEEAFKIYQDRINDSTPSFDLIITDYQMPKSDGADLVRKISAVEKILEINSPIMLVTTLTEDQFKKDITQDYLIEDDISDKVTFNCKQGDNIDKYWDKIKEFVLENLKINKAPSPSIQNTDNNSKISQVSSPKTASKICAGMS